MRAGRTLVTAITSVACLTLNLWAAIVTATQRTGSWQVFLALNATLSVWHATALITAVSCATRETLREDGAL